MLHIFVSFDPVSLIHVSHVQWTGCFCHRMLFDQLEESTRKFVEAPWSSAGQKQIFMIRTPCFFHLNYLDQFGAIFWSLKEHDENIWFCLHLGPRNWYRIKIYKYPGVGQTSCLSVICDKVVGGWEVATPVQSQEKVSIQAFCNHYEYSCNYAAKNALNYKCDTVCTPCVQQEVNEMFKPSDPISQYFFTLWQKLCSIYRLLI